MDTGLPASIEIAWGVRERSGKGPKRGLTIARIVDAAIAVASGDGLAAVSMNRVASELGASTMSLYRYVATKDELLALMADAPFGTTPRSRGSRERWRAALARWAREHLDVLRRHPWLVRIPTSGPPLTPNHVAWLEVGLDALRGTGLSDGEKISVILLVNGFVRNEALLKSDLQAALGAHSSMANPRTSYGALLSHLIDPARFPALNAVVASGTFEGVGDPDADFAFGLDRILDGVAALIDQR